MTPAIMTSALARTRQIARYALAALLVAGGVGATGHAHADDHGIAALRVASYNVQFVTPDLPLVRHLLREWPGHKPNVTTRAEAIATRLACFDIVALQETINDRRRREMFERLESAGRACGMPSRLPSGRMFAFVDGPDVADESSWLPLVGDELALASRLPVIATEGHVYRQATGEDMLAAKGVLHAQLAGGADDFIDVFVTHLQAGSEHGAVRRGQIEELSAFIRRTRNGGAHPVLVLGDFNVRGSRVDRRDPGSDYHFLVQQLNAAVAPRRFIDAWLATNAEDPETASGTKPRVLLDGTLRPHEERIDYIFLTGPGATPRAMRLDFFASDLIVDGAPVGHLSDHAAVLAEISASPATARLAASGP
jgi:endonuclease/exonuclease/phosphatase family metal-dependent hydrolase